MRNLRREIESVRVTIRREFFVYHDVEASVQDGRMENVAFETEKRNDIAIVNWWERRKRNGTYSRP